MCCKAMTLECLACAADQDEETYCFENPETVGCEPPSKCDELSGDWHEVDGECCLASHTSWNKDFSAPLECCKTEIINWDGTCSTPSEGGRCIGEIDSMHKRCRPMLTKDDCESEGKSFMSDGVCDWLAGEPPCPDVLCGCNHAENMWTLTGYNDKGCDTCECNVP